MCRRLRDEIMPFCIRRSLTPANLPPHVHGLPCQILQLSVSFGSLAPTLSLRGMVDPYKPSPNLKLVIMPNLAPLCRTLRAHVGPTSFSKSANIRRCWDPTSFGWGRIWPLSTMLFARWVTIWYLAVTFQIAWAWIMAEAKNFWFSVGPTPLI